MTYVSNHTADIATRAKQRAALEAEQRAFLRRGGKITEAPGFTASVAEAGAKLSAWRSSDGRHNNRNAKRLKRQEVES